MKKGLLQGCLAAALAALNACASVAGAPAGEVGELLTMGSERPLRDSMRPLTGGPRVLVFALDGVGADDLQRALDEGRMPRLAALLGAPAGGGVYRNAYSVPDVLSVLPSTTTAAWASVFTGEPPARTGIPGNEWFARDEMAFYAPVPITVPERAHALKLYTDELLSGLLETATLYEQADVRSFVSFHPVFRGADLLTVPNLASFGDLFGAVVEGAVTGGISTDRKIHEETDQRSVGDLVETLHDRGVPQLQVVYFPGIDLYTHVAEDPLRSQQDYLGEITDTEIGDVLDAYAELGVLDSTYVVLVADHGHTPVLQDDRHALEAEGEGEPPRVLEQAGFRVRPPSLTVDEEDFQAVLASQGAVAYVYLADRSTCLAPGTPCEWSRPPRLQEDVLPVVRAFHAASESGAGVPELRGTLDLIVVSHGDGPPRIFDGEELLPVAEYLRRYPRPDLLALEDRLRGLLEGPFGGRAGDVLLFARSGMHRPIEERFYFGPPYRSEHGSAHPQDSRVPLLVAHPGRSGAELRERVRAVVGERATQLDVTPLVRELLGRE